MLKSIWKWQDNKKQAGWLFYQSGLHTSTAKQITSHNFPTSLVCQWSIWSSCGGVSFSHTVIILWDESLAVQPEYHLVFISLNNADRSEGGSLLSYVVCSSFSMQWWPNIKQPNLWQKIQSEQFKTNSCRLYGFSLHYILTTIVFTWRPNYSGSWHRKFSVALKRAIPHYQTNASLSWALQEPYFYLCPLAHRAIELLIMP